MLRHFLSLKVGCSIHRSVGVVICLQVAPERSVGVARLFLPHQAVVLSCKKIILVNDGLLLLASPHTPQDHSDGSNEYRTSYAANNSTDDLLATATESRRRTSATTPILDTWQDCGDGIACRGSNYRIRRDD